MIHLIELTYAVSPMLKRFAAEQDYFPGTLGAGSSRKEEAAKDIANIIKGFHGDVCKGKSNVVEEDVVEAGAQFRST